MGSWSLIQVHLASAQNQINVAMGGGAQADIIQNRYLQLAILIFYLIISFPVQTKS